MESRCGACRTIRWRTGPWSLPSLWLPMAESRGRVAAAVGRDRPAHRGAGRPEPAGRAPAEDAASAVGAELQASLDELHEVTGLADALHREAAIEEDQVRSLDSRIASLDDDIRRSRDTETLHEMGAPVNAVTPPDCPTCHQELPSTLLDPAAAIVPMPIERNIVLLKEQIDLFRAMRTDVDTAIAAKRQQLASFDERVHSLQQAVRAQRETLVSASGTPSIEDVERRVHLRDRIDALRAVYGRLAGLNTTLAQMAQTWSGLLEDQRRLREQGTPQMGRDKISRPPGELPGPAPRVRVQERADRGAEHLRGHVPSDVRRL